MSLLLVYLILISPLFLIICFVITLLVIALIIQVWFEPVKKDCSCSARLEGKVALVVGGNSGIGLETTRELARRGARVLIASRDTEKSRAAVADIVASTGNDRVDCRHLDLAKLSSVRRFAEDFNRTEPRLDILVNNAGLLKPLKSKLTEDGINEVMQINYFGPFLLTNLLLSKLEASQPSRVVIVSSIAHRFGAVNTKNIADVRDKSWNVVYARSKLLQVIWTRALATRVPPGVTVNAVHPGIVKTDIFSQLGPVSYLIYFLIDMLFKTPSEGAQASVHACLSPELGKSSGGYYAGCRPGKVAAIVNDDRVVDRVWEDSLMLTKSS